MKSPSAAIGKGLKVKGLKATPQRLAVIDAATRAKGYFTPQGLHEILKSRHAVVGLTTVYRALEALESAGLICRIESTGDERLYARCSYTHHHHLICESCAAVIELDSCTLSGLTGQLERETGFVIRGHSLEFRGLCRVCALSSKGNPEETV